MKTLIFSLRSLAILFIGMTTLGLTSCNQNDDTQIPALKETIVGTWNVTSYKVEGDEYIGLIMASASLTFEAYEGAQGEFEQTVAFSDGESVSIAGAYTVDSEAGKITMNYDGDIIIAEVAITDGHLEWDGQQDGYPLVMLADKE